jgi:SulP family sulfate permease
LSHVGEANPWTLAIGLGSCSLLLFFRFALAPLLERLGARRGMASGLARTGPLVAVVVCCLLVYSGQLAATQGVAIVGDIPGGLPGLTVPHMGWPAVRSLLPLALVITLVGYLESISVAKALASRRREKVDPDRELAALGMADVAAAFTGGYPVTGGFSRSLVNYTSGVRTPLGSIFTAALVALALLFLTPLFFYIPQAVLAAIIVVAVAGLLDLRTPWRLWRYCRPDAIALVVTFVAVLALGIEQGILAGVVATVVLQMWKTSRPHVAEVGRVGRSEHFRNIRRHGTQPVPGLLAFRVDESLNFANAPYLESWLIEQISSRPDIRSVLLICSGVNDVDSTGIEILETLIRELRTAGIGFYMAEVKGPVSDRLQRAGLDKDFLDNQIFMSTHEAVSQLAAAADVPEAASRVAENNEPQETGALA